MAKSKTTKLTAELLDKRDKCRTDKLFLSQQLGYDFQAKTHTELFENYLQIDPSKTLQDQSTVKDRLVLWSRGTYKTTSIVVEIVQLIINFPDIRILLMQDTVKNAMVLLDEVRKHFDGTHHKSKLSEIFPEFCIVDKKLGTKMSFTVPARTANRKEATVTVASPRSTKTGMHFEVGFFDDLVTAENYDSPDQVQKTITDFGLYTPLIDPGGYRYVTGTRYVFGDLYEHILRQDAESHTWQISIRACWTVNDDGSKTLLFPQVKLADGRLIGHTIEFLEQKQAEDPVMFAAQYLNQPISVTTQLFTEALILSHVRTPEEKDFPALGPKTLFIDLASSKNRDSDDSVVLCGQQDSMNRVFCTDGIGGRWSPAELASVVIEQALKHRPIRIYIENSAAGTMFVEYLKVVALAKGVNLPLDFIKVNNKPDAKHLRISLCSGHLKQNKLFFFQGLPCWSKLFDQFTKYPQRHDDYPDTIALMCQHFQATAPTPQVRSLASYIFAAEPEHIPAFITQDNEPHSFGGSMGGFFDE